MAATSNKKDLQGKAGLTNYNQEFNKESLIKMSEISKAGNTSLDINVKEYGETTRELIKAYKEMHTGGANTDQDQLVLDGLSQVRNDVYMVFTMQGKTIMEKNNNDLFLYAILGGISGAGLGYCFGNNDTIAASITHFYQKICGLLPMRKR